MTALARWFGRYDRRVIVLVFMLLLAGAAMVHAGTAYSQGASDPSSYGKLPSHLTRIGIGILVCVLAAQVHFRRTAYLAMLGWVGAVVLLVMVVGSKYAVSNSTIARWIHLFGVTFQPVELAKLAFVLALPAWIDRDPARLRRGARELFVFLLPLGVVVGLLLLQPNFASAMALTVIYLLVLWIAGAPARWMAALLALGLLGSWFAFTHVSKLETRLESWRTVLFDERFDAGSGYQPYQALMGLGNGGILGARAGESLTRYEYLPDCHTDFVFAVAGETTGFVGVSFLLVVYALLIARALKIAHQSRDGQAYLTAVAIGCMVGVYALINIAMVSGLIPVMGLPLPFLSYGGSAMVTNMAAIGVLLNISRGARAVSRTTARWEGVAR